MENHARNYVKIIKEICAENGITLKRFCYDWVFMLERNGKRTFVVGYTFGLDSGAAQTMCSDKCAASEILKASGVPCVEHWFFLTPEECKYFPERNNWSELSGLLKKYGRLVCKANQGSGGENIYFAENQTELENAAFKIFSKTRGMAVSPYVEIEQEYRVIMLNGRNKLAYSKQRQYVTGDGKRTAAQLVRDKRQPDGKVFDYDRQLLTENEFVPGLGQKIYLSRKHNLGLGAYAEVERDEAVLAELTALAEKAVRALDLKFISVDIVKDAHTGEYKVLEINSGVMMEHFAGQSEENYQAAKEIYRQAVEELL